MPELVAAACKAATACAMLDWKFAGVESAAVTHVITCGGKFGMVESDGKSAGAKDGFASIVVRICRARISSD